MRHDPSSTRTPPRFPLAPVSLVPRRELIARLDAATDVKMITLAAPGGSGKSTVLSQWLGDESRRVVWLTVPSGSDTLSVAERIAVEFASDSTSTGLALPIVHEEALWFSVVLPAMAGVMAGQPEPFVLVLDDAMNVSDRLTDSLIETLVGSLPEAAQLVWVTRGAPPHAARRLRPSGRTLELGASDLAMSNDEARALLEELAVHLPEDQLAQAVERTEGWPVGIYLLGRAILSEPDLLATDGVPALTQEWISDYIRDELFDELEYEEAEFLMRVSVLDHLTGPSCDAVAGSTGSLVRLRRLSAANQLIVRTSEGEESYRIHQLFTDFLRGELRGRSIKDFEASHARAARWFADHGKEDQAVAHLREAGDDAALGDFVWGHSWRLLATGQMPVMRRWMDGLDQDRIDSHPGLCLTVAWIGMHEGDMAKALRHAEVARNIVRRGESPHQYSSHVAVTDSVIGADGLTAIVASTTEAIDAQGDTDPWTSLALFLRGVAHIHFDRVDEGFTDLVEGQRIADRYEVTHMRAQLLAAQAVVRLAQGDEDAAGVLITRARSVVIDSKLESIPTGAPIFTASALVLLATGRRDEAAAESVRALRLTALIESIAPWHAVEGRLRLAQVYRGLGDADRAAVLAKEARERYSPAARSPLLDRMFHESPFPLDDAGRTPAPSLLTTAELRVLQYLPSHLSFPEIGQQLWLSRHTVKSQAMSAYRKLGAASRSEAVTRARQLGLLPPR